MRKDEWYEDNWLAERTERSKAQLALPTLLLLAAAALVAAALAAPAWAQQPTPRPARPAAGQAQRPAAGQGQRAARTNRPAAAQAAAPAAATTRTQTTAPSSAAASASPSSAPIPPVKGNEAVFKISETVVLKDPPRFGLNMDPPHMTHWSEEPWNNSWCPLAVPNPFYARTKGNATGGGADFLEDQPGANKKGLGSGWALGFYDVFRDGFFDGGTAVVYRYDAQGKCSLVRESKIKKFQASKDGVNRVTFEDAGPAVQAGDEYLLTVTRADVPKGVSRPGDVWPTVLNTWVPEKKGATDPETSIDPTTAPPNGGGGSLKVALPGGEPVLLGNWLLSGAQPDYPRFHAGAPYVFSVWLKQTGMATGKVTINVAKIKSATFDVTSDWKEYRVEFAGAPPAAKGPERLEVGSDEKGTLWIDNPSLTESDPKTPPEAFYPQVRDEIKKYHPGTIRIWAMQVNKGFGPALDACLGSGFSAPLMFSERGLTRTNNVGLGEQLALCEEVQSDPWLIVSTMFTPEEYRNLIEYLAGPADSPYGKIRAAAGHPEPWTKAFKNIYLEMGNETWNSMFSPQNFVGRGAQYGAYAELAFATMKSSPHFDAGKFRFILNGWSAQPTEKGFGALAAQASPSADYVGMAYYVGGWDAVGNLGAASPDEAWNNGLLFYARMLASGSATNVSVLNTQAKDRGKSLAPVLYEAGPGYSLPGPGKVDAQEQLHGKSMVKAITTIDAFMNNLKLGFGPQNFFTFKTGNYWASHNRQWQPHIAWLALEMRNTLLEGDLIDAKTIQVPTMDLPKAENQVPDQKDATIVKKKTFPAVSDVPLALCYAFKKDNRYSTMLISRRLKGDTPVTLELPYDPSPEVQVYSLQSDDPGANNIEKMEVDIKKETKNDFAKTYKMTLKPFSVVVLVNNAK